LTSSRTLAAVHPLITLISERISTFSSQPTSVNDEHVTYPEVT